MKPYTDLNQSKKLAEILPLESADMYYPNRIDIKYQGALPIEFKLGNPLISQEIQAWSLAALFEEIPEIIDFEDDESDYALEILKENGLYYLSYGNPLEHSRIEIEPQGHFVDACVTMIEKLHELKML